MNYLDFRSGAMQARTIIPRKPGDPVMNRDEIEQWIAGEYRRHYDKNGKAINLESREVNKMDESKVEKQTDSEKVGKLKNIYYQSTGTETWTKHWAGFGTYTDGVRAIAETAEAFWLLDAIFSYRRKEQFQLWVLNVVDGKAILTMQEDSDLEPVVTQEINFTDFPTGRWEFYLENEVLCLPDER